MKNEIMERIAEITPFSFQEIKSSYLLLKSIDKVIAAVEYSACMGILIPNAVFDILKNEIEIPAERLEILYD